MRATFASNFVPLSGGGGGGTIIVEGRAVEKGEQRGISLIAVTPHFNSTLGLPVVEGRDFTDAEGWSHSPVAVINKQMKSRFWPSGDVIGRMKVKPEHPEDDVIDNDLILVWGDEKRIITGADLLGRLLRGIVMLDAKTN